MPIKHYAMLEVTKEWDYTQWDSFNWIVTVESNWVHVAQNPNSSAFGLGQFLDSTWEQVECEKTDDPRKQIDGMIRYVRLRYDTPDRAKDFHLANNHY